MIFKTKNIILIIVFFVLYILAFKFLSRTAFYIVGTMLILGSGFIYAMMNMEGR